MPCPVFVFHRKHFKERFITEICILVIHRKKSQTSTVEMADESVTENGVDQIVTEDEQQSHMDNGKEVQTPVAAQVEEVAIASETNSMSNSNEQTEGSGEGFNLSRPMIILFLSLPVLKLLGMWVRR